MKPTAPKKPQNNLRPVVSNAIPISTFAVAGNIYLRLALGYARLSSCVIVDFFQKLAPTPKMLV
jgi:hypothetical protein